MGWLNRNTVTATALAATMIMGFEGKSLVAYLDPPKIPTICYGHTSGVKLGDTATDQECVVFLQQDMLQKEHGVNRLLKVPVSPYVKAALIDFAYNVGEGALASSTALRHINAGRILEGCNALETCVKAQDGRMVGYGCGWAGGVMYKGLQKRRQAEAEMCRKGI